MAIQEKSFQPADYQKYVQRGPDSYVNWEKMSQDVTKLFMDEASRRENIKADIDDRTQSLYDQLAEVEVNKDGKWSDEVLSSANQIRKALGTYNSLLKKGAISVTEYKTQMERVKGQMSELNIITKELGSTYDLHQGRLAVGENGEVLAAPDEIAVFNSASGYGKLKNTKIYIDPVTMNAFMYKLDDDGKIPDFTKNPEKFLAVNNSRAILNYTNDRSQYVISDVSKNYVDDIGKFVSESLQRFSGEFRDGTYVLSEEGIRAMNNSGFGDDINAEMSDLKNIIFEKLTAEGDKGLANTISTLNGDYIMAMSEDEFKKKGGTDLKYFIKIDPDAADGMTYEFSSDAARDAAIAEIKENVGENVELMVGKSIKVSNPTYEPGESAVQAGEGANNDATASYFRDLKNIVGGGEGNFSASVEDLKDKANARLADSGSQITDITREKNFIEIVIVDSKGNRTVKTIDRFETDDNGAYTDVKIPDSVIYQKLNTELRPSGYDDSFEALETAATDGGFSYDFEEGTYYGDETRTNVTPYTEKTHKPFSDTFTVGDDAKAVKYSNTLQSKISATGYSNQLSQFKSHLPGELSSALSKQGIDIKPSGFVITGTDLRGGSNEFKISYTNPYNGKKSSKTFLFNTHNSSTDNTTDIMNAMDTVMNDIIAESNRTKGGTENNQGAP